MRPHVVTGLLVSVLLARVSCILAQPLPTLSDWERYGVEKHQVAWNEAGVEHITAIVLTRRSKRTGMLDSASANAAERLYRDVSRAARDSMYQIGSSGTDGRRFWVESDLEGTWVRFLGRRFELPVRDSAVVFMVDRIDSVGGPPVIVGTAMIDGRFPHPTPREWMSGDTIKRVFPPQTDELLSARLRAVPAVAAFLPVISPSELVAARAVKPPVSSGMASILDQDGAVIWGGGGVEFGTSVYASTFTTSENVRGVTNHWLNFVVLWKGQPDWRGVGLDPPVERQMQAVVRGMEDRGFTAFGIGANRAWSAMGYNRDKSTMEIDGRILAIPRRDSTLVVMIDQLDGIGGPPKIEGILYLPARLPPTYFDNDWAVGDTLLMIPGKRRSLLESMLRQSPIIRAFLR